VAAFFNFSDMPHKYVYTPKEDETLTILIHSDWDCYSGSIPRPGRARGIKARGIGGASIELPAFSAMIYRIRKGI
jgi:hypothetical protein